MLEKNDAIFLIKIKYLKIIKKRLWFYIKFI